MTFADTSVDLEIIILSETSQKERDSMTQMNLSVKQKRAHRHKEKTCGCQRKGREGNRRIGSLGLADTNYYIQDG